MDKNATNGAGGNVSGGVDLADYQRIKAELRKHVVANMVKSIGPNKVMWRQTLVVRRADHNKYAPDEDLVAYSAIHKLKNPADDSKQKITVSDFEIAAYKELDPDFSKTLTLAEVLNKAKELMSAGQRTGVGGKTGGGEGSAEIKDLPE